MFYAPLKLEYYQSNSHEMMNIQTKYHVSNHKYLISRQANSNQYQRKS